METKQRHSWWQHLIRRGKAQVYVLCLVWAALVGGAQYRRFGPLVNQELGSIDLRFRVRGPEPPAPQIVILAIGQDSIVADTFSAEELAAQPQLAQLRSFPFPRSVYAEAIHRLCAAGARVIGIDLLFPGPREGDDQLREALAQHPDRVILAGNFSDSGTALMLPVSVVPPSIPMENVAGYVNYWPDADDFVRQAEYCTTAAEVAGVPPAAQEPRLFSFDALLARRADPTLLWPPPAGSVYIDFPGPPGTFPTHPFYKLFYDKAWQQDLRNGAVFRGKVVLIGPAGNFQHDEHLTPFGEGMPLKMPGVEIHAAAIGTLLQRSALRPAPRWIGWLSILAMSVVTAMILTLTVHPVRKLLSLLALCAVYVGLVFLAFRYGRTVLSVVAPIWTAAGGGFLGIAGQLVVAQVDKRRMRHILETYVSKPVADEILRNDEEYRNSLGGERREVAILFSDIRGFTPISEQLPPGELVNQLNEYFTAMVGAVMKHDGTLDKFIGDAVMAVYGAPLSAGPVEDAWRAVQTAQEMRLRLRVLQETWTRQGRPPFRIGIGLNRGEVVVGNIGSPQRMGYTVVGDAVNIAARVEALTKEYHTDILLTESVYDLVKDRIEVNLIGGVRVRGRTGEVKVYELVGLRTAAKT